MPHPFASLLALACLLAPSLAPAPEVPLPLASSLSPKVFDFAFSARGGVTIAASGEARFGMVEATSDMPRFFSLTLGTAGEEGTIVFSHLAPAVPLAGKYTIRPWDARGDGRSFHAVFIAGTAANPQGVFHAESGSITIRSTRPDAIEGTFTLKAQGFLSGNPDNESVRVTVHGTFVARGGAMIAQVTPMN